MRFPTKSGEKMKYMAVAIDEIPADFPLNSNVITGAGKADC
jgi:hypothetical protein